MFDSFKSRYLKDGFGRAGAEIVGVAEPDLREFFGEFGGVSFSAGLYRVIHPADGERWRERLLTAFPDYSSRAFCFGYDWLGRLFALDSSRSHDGKTAVLLFDPGFDEVLLVPANLQSFHNKILLEEADAAVATKFHKHWIESGGAAPSYDQCVGYKKPCFLGGVDEFENVELSDLDVYWHLTAQLIEEVRGLPPGSRVRIKLD